MKWSLIDSDNESLRIIKLGDKDILHVSPNAIATLSRTAFEKLSFYLRREQLDQFSGILDDIEASPNDKRVARMLLCNASISACEGLPLCQDTGTAVIVGWKGDLILSEGDEEALGNGVREAYRDNPLRYSIMVPTSLFEESNSKTNLPADITLNSKSGSEYSFIFCAKGGGSANKTALYQMTKAILRPDHLENWLFDKMMELGPAACPPYHVCFVIGGSPDKCIITAKLGTMHALDDLPYTSDGSGSPFRDEEMEQTLFQRSRSKPGIGAQLGGISMILDVIVVRLPRHAASVCIGMAVACVADRVVQGKINRDGLWLEDLEENPSSPGLGDHDDVHIDLESDYRHELSKLPLGAAVTLSGPVIVARDVAHTRWCSGDYNVTSHIEKYPIFYAGPAKAKSATESGSIGPTTSSRMDSYIDNLQAKVPRGIVTIGKGSRHQNVVDCCKKYGGFYLATPGGVAALTAKKFIVSEEIVDFEELGMEAVRLVVVKDLPCIIAVNGEGSFYPVL